jgi:hypothetical protein
VTEPSPWRTHTAVSRTMSWAHACTTLCLFAATGRLARGGRRLRLRLAAHWRWASVITTTITRLQAVPGTDLTAAHRPDDQKQTPREPGTPPTASDIRAPTLASTRRR